jgi:hypothetical protein
MKNIFKTLSFHYFGEKDIMGLPFISLLEYPTRTEVEVGWLD